MAEEDSREIETEETSESGQNNERNITASEMEREITEMKKNWEKTSEYIKQMEKVEEEMDYEFKKIMAEMESIQKAIKKLDRDQENKKERFKILKEKVGEAKELKEKACNTIQKLQKNPSSVKEAEVKEILDETKLFQRDWRQQWDEYYMKIACLAALRSKDPRTPVGVCIADTESYQIVGIGYNSMPCVKGRSNNDKIFPWKGLSENASKEEKNNKDKNTELKYPFAVHAAVNAITNRTRDKLDGCTIYVTLKPDEDCARAIQQAGIKEVVYCIYKRTQERETRNTGMMTAEAFLKSNNIELKNLGESASDKFTGNEVVKGLQSRIHEPQPNDDEPYKNALTWEDFFMEIAKLSRERPGLFDTAGLRLRTGACIVSPSNQVMAVGYSGYPEDMELGEIIEYDKEYIAHAEYKAIIGGPSVRGCTLYVTSYPCNVCAKLIAQSGISEIVYGKPHIDPGAKKILKECLDGKSKIRPKAI
ncbi:PREDICTED: uncharacterized protein LOC100639305 [Amphimedon queenslandica]|uniref:dCMP deaminase n=2 Tax=Amphimedon queenslandica TaxID=400682 RepID=A0AAN0JUW8_AMPQE|nr:PREDICTED: uncharacterized protein LOC100639305 [Amphimedon queenslandica]XP_019860860.1 PREDICTED: uncharacterized protein LOC100639305 [Amphimedon queenslandica]|eukprot:XP_019860856.1 PREDICTED: uncharacterized protein LOC100639305 [Amphimedon queenslandica]